MSSKDKKASSKDKKAKSDKKAGDTKVKKEKVAVPEDGAGAAPAAPSNSGSYPHGIVAAHQILTHFDETNGIAVSRADNTNGKVVPLAEAYLARYNKLRELLSAKVLPKREHLVNMLRRLQHTSVEVEEKRKSIEKETLTDTEQIIARLKNIESMRQSSIAHQVNVVKSELEAIDRLCKRVEVANVQNNTQNYGITYASAVPGGKPVETVQLPRAVEMVELIHSFAALSADIETTATKPITVQVDFQTEDFPRETSERLEIMARCDRYVHAVNVKDQMLWTFMQEKSLFEEKITDVTKMNEEYAQEVANWAQFSHDLSQQIVVLKAEKEAVERRNRELQAVMRKHNIYFDQI